MEEDIKKDQKKTEIINRPKDYEEIQNEIFLKKQTDRVKELGQDDKLDSIRNQNTKKKNIIDNFNSEMFFMRME